MYKNKPHGNKGRKHTQETREKIAAAMRNNSNGIVPDELRIHPQRKAKGDHALKGKPKSAEHRQKIAAAMRNNSNASVLNRALNLRMPQTIKPLACAPTISQRFNESPKEYKPRKGHSEETKAKIRAALEGNHNAVKEHIELRRQTKATQASLNTTENNDDLQTLEQELMAMLNKDKSLPLHAAPPKPYTLQETPEEREIRQRKNAEEVLGKDFFDGWE